MSKEFYIKRIQATKEIHEAMDRGKTENEIIFLITLKYGYTTTFVTNKMKEYDAFLKESVTKEAKE